jgi:hypothetical protein
MQILYTSYTYIFNFIPAFAYYATLIMLKNKIVIYDELHGSLVTGIIYKQTHRNRANFSQTEKKSFTIW